MKVKIVVDSCGDTHQSVLEKYDIGMIPLNIHIGKMMRDGIDITPEDYYKIIEDVELPDTSAPNLSQWKECFDTYLEKDNYDKLVLVTIAQKLSNTYEQACVAARKYYPSKIEVLDSMSASAGEGIVAIKFSELLKKGYDSTTVYNFMQNLRLKVVQIGYMNTLKMLVKSGRISKASEFIASIGRLKPMIITKNGENLPLGKAISLKSAKKKAIEEMAERIDPSLSYSLFVTHAEAKESAKELEEIMKERFSISKSFISYMGPVVGSRMGKGAVFITTIPDLEPTE